MRLDSGVAFEGGLKSLQVVSKCTLHLCSPGLLRDLYRGASDGSLLHSAITEGVGFAKPREALFK